MVLKGMVGIGDKANKKEKDEIDRAKMCTTTLIVDKKE